jgi:hypothetical protein
MSQAIEASEARALIALHTVTAWEPQVLEREDSDEYNNSMWYLDAT